MSELYDEELKEDEGIKEDDSLQDVKEKSEEDLLELKDKEVEELKNQLIRLQADFMNFRRRANKEKESAISYGAECFVCDILPSIDNFQRALDSETEKESGFYQGVEMIYQELIKKLKDNGVVEIEALGKEFDPNFHNAVFMEESDEYESGKVIEVIQTGYMLKDKVIRPSMVKVAK